MRTRLPTSPRKGAKMGTERHAIRNPTNSRCDSAELVSLDFEEWWTDNSFGQTYLHVSRRIDDTYHRVYCKHSNNPRVGMSGGMPFWHVDKEGGSNG